MPKPKLKSCPFCGEDAIVFKEFNPVTEKYEFEGVGCVKCEIYIKGIGLRKYTEQRAIQAWNRRVK